MNDYKLVCISAEFAINYYNCQKDFRVKVPIYAEILVRNISKHYFAPIMVLYYHNIPCMFRLHRDFD